MPSQKVGEVGPLASFGLSRGLIQVYTGNGKGKTTAAFGLVLRALGNDLRVTVVQFMKTGDSGEARALSQLGPAVSLRAFGRPGFVHRRGVQREDREEALRGLGFAVQVMREGGADLLVLDELNNALYFELLQLDEVLPVLEAKPAGMEVVITGRNAPDALLEMADLITEMHEVKHPYNDGLRARRGIEF